ncbi:phosphotransferase family protein [Halogeometricum limi]|uniref:Predicted kinase, aminoglycoside phosphotransferase (APT) family n=1 Tax=Halogeometricum limi TaxID=555875 RepID=A0A1I6IL35_9EURY|nr:phosphotransferase family protein [Halogeometricum limi]SFR67445.1 Predicted kinase, aminoglycoside phosphotransferase (APT) family [Halogeometricum limi]
MSDDGDDGTETHGGDDAYFRRLVDEDALRAYLETELGPASTFEVTRHPAGHSNETLFLTWGDRRLVIRRPPPGETAETAHDVLREHRVMDALQETPVPLPETVLACENHDVLGCDFYVMSRVAGDVLRETEPERFANESARRRLGEELVDTLAAIHEVDPAAVGLADFGRAEGYTRRQVDRWGKQLAWAFERTTEEREVPVLREVGAWLDENAPETHPETLVHGDYKLDNVLYGPSSDPELRAVFDWEMSTLGDPRADLGWMLSYWRDAGDPDPAVPELETTFMERPGYPTRRELVDRYEQRTGTEFSHQRFYRALAVYKLAALGEMFFRRYLEGNSDDPMYPLMEERVPALAERAKRIVDGEEPL